jgi:hypothetical protein
MVVLKRILPQLAVKKDFVEMFLDEARIAATLQHPNVVQTYDVGVVDGNYFIAMEYLHGEELRTIIKTLYRDRRRLPIEHSLNIMISLCAGLHYAHEKIGFDGRPLNIVHRDVTPRNIIVTFDGGVKLLDFGIARADGRSSETRYGTLKGKIPYMSPEQCKGEPLDRRADIFSLGILLYESTLGRRLFRGASDFEVLKRIVEGDVTPPTALDASYPQGLERIVMRALARDKTARYQTVAEIQAELEALAQELGLYLSSTTLKRFMHELFGQKIEDWQRAQAEGRSLAETFSSYPELIVQSLPEDEVEGGTGRSATAPGLALDRAAVKPAPAAPAAPASTVQVGEEMDELPRHRLPRVAILVGLGALAVAAVVALAWLSPHSPPRARPPAGAAPVANPAAQEELLGVPAAGGAVAMANPAAQGELPGAPATVAATGTEGPDAHKAAHAQHGHHHGVSAPGTGAAPAPVERRDGEGTLVLASSPWCTVTIDGVDRGPTPVSAKLPAGKHSIVLANPEFKIRRALSVTIQPNEILRKKLEFAQ